MRGLPKGGPLWQQVLSFCPKCTQPRRYSPPTYTLQSLSLMHSAEPPPVKGLCVICGQVCKQGIYLDTYCVCIVPACRWVNVNSNSLSWKAQGIHALMETTKYTVYPCLSRQGIHTALSVYTLSPVYKPQYNEEYVACCSGPWEIIKFTLLVSRGSHG